MRALLLILAILSWMVFALFAIGIPAMKVSARPGVFLLVCAALLPFGLLAYWLQPKSKRRILPPPKL